MRLARTLLALMALVLATGGLLACGSAGGSNSDAKSLLKQTFSGKASSKSGKIDLQVNLDLKGIPSLNGPVSLRLSGPFEGDKSKSLPKFDLEAQFQGSGQTVKAGATSTGTAAFVSFQNTAYAIAPQVFDAFKTGYERNVKNQNGAKSNPSLGSLGIDPSAWLTNPKVVGDSDVGGTNTTHITAGVNVPKLLDGVNQLVARARKLGVQGAANLPSQITAANRAQFEKAVKSASFDVYTGKDDKILRRLKVNLDLAGSNGRGGKIALDLKITDLNKSQTITAPASPKPFTELLTAIQGLTGALGVGGASGAGGATGAGPSTSNGGAAASPQAQAYLNCIGAAATAKARADCVGKLGNP